MEFDLASITKLNGDNYNAWKMRLTSLLSCYKLLDIVDGSTPRPIFEGDSQDKWIQGNNEAMNVMLTTMLDEVVGAILGCSTAHEIWDRLGTMYQCNTESGKPRTTKELEELKKRTTCHLCKVQGHWKRECPDKKNESKVSEEVASYAIDNSWICASGADRHYCGKMEWFYEYVKYDKPKPAGIAENSKMLVEGSGKVKVKAFIRGQWRKLEIHDVEYVPGGGNLFSENILLGKGYDVRKDQSGDIIYYRGGIPDIEAIFQHGIQIMKFKPIVHYMGYY